MKAVRLVEKGKPLVLQEIGKPAPGPREVLVRVRAAGICRSDAHYRSGATPVGRLPLTPGHEIAGVVEEVGAEVARLKPGDRVCLHYMLTCGLCEFCNLGREQFCRDGAMLGKHADGGYAEFVAVPERSAVPLPDEIPFEHGAVMMCSSATAQHALVKGRLRPGESTAVFGVGGLGISAIQLAKAWGADPVIAVDVKSEKLELARRFGAEPVNAVTEEPVDAVRRITGGRGADVALELIGLPETIARAVKCLAVFGRAVVVGLTAKPFVVNPYTDILCREAELIGCSDHLASEIPGLLEWYRRGALDLTGVVSRTVPLEAGAVNEVLDRLDRFSEEVRVVITP